MWGLKFSLGGLGVKKGKWSDLEVFEDKYVINRGLKGFRDIMR